MSLTQTWWCRRWTSGDVSRDRPVLCVCAPRDLSSRWSPLSLRQQVLHSINIHRQCHWHSSRTYTTFMYRFISFVYRFASSDNRHGRTQHSCVVLSRLWIVSCLLTIVTDVHNTLACRFVSFVHRFVSADDRNGRTQHSRVVSSRLCIVSCLLTIVTDVHNIRVSFRLVCVSFHLFRDSSQTYFHDICVWFCNFRDSHWCTDIDTDQWVSTALVECTEVPPGHDVCPLPSACSTAAAVSCPSHLCRTPVCTTHHTLDSYYITSN